jgi:hypothetical protein
MQPDLYLAGRVFLYAKENYTIRPFSFLFGVCFFASKQTA